MSIPLDPNFRPRRSTQSAPYSATEAAQILQHAATTNLSLSAYGVRYQIEGRQLYWWRDRLAQTAGSGATACSNPPSRALAFIPVTTAIAGPPAACLTDSGVELGVGDIAIRLRPGFCSETLRRAVAVLTGGAPC